MPVRRSRWYPEVGKTDAVPDITKVKSNIDNWNLQYKPARRYTDNTGLCRHQQKLKTKFERKRSNKGTKKYSKLDYLGGLRSSTTIATWRPSEISE